MMVPRGGPAEHVDVTAAMHEPPDAGFDRR